MIFQKFLLGFTLSGFTLLGFTLLGFTLLGFTLLDFSLLGFTQHTECHFIHYISTNQNSLKQDPGH